MQTSFTEPPSRVDLVFMSWSPLNRKKESEKPSRNLGHTQLIRECSPAVISAHWATVGWHLAWRVDLVFTSWSPLKWRKKKGKCRQEAFFNLPPPPPSPPAPPPPPFTLHSCSHMWGKTLHYQREALRTACSHSVLCFASSACPPTATTARQVQTATLQRHKILCLSAPLPSLLHPLLTTRSISTPQSAVPTPPTMSFSTLQRARASLDRSLGCVCVRTRVCVCMSVCECVCVCVCVCAVCVIVKCPLLLPCAVDGLYRNLFYYY